MTSEASPIDAVIEVSGVQWATQKHAVEAMLRACPGVESLEANPVEPAANSHFDPRVTSLPISQRGDPRQPHSIGSAGARSRWSGRVD
jgi:hypothetical protein